MYSNLPKRNYILHDRNLILTRKSESAGLGDAEFLDS